MGLVLLDKTEQLEKIIAECKSDSGVCGKRLRAAHYTAGRLLGEKISKSMGASNIAVVIMLRSGLPFGLGIADELECASAVRVFFCDEAHGLKLNVNADDFDKVLVVDAVIRTGKSMLDWAEKLNAPEKVVFATNVIDESGICNFDGKNVFAVRASKHSFVGSAQKAIVNGKGPDTGDRLFYSDF